MNILAALCDNIKRFGIYRARVPIAVHAPKSPRKVRAMRRLAFAQKPFVR